MHTRLLALSCLVTATTFAADAPKLPAIAASGIEQSERRTSFPEGAIATKEELLFSDDSERAELGKAWAIVVPTYSIEKGALRRTQMRFDAPEVIATPAADAKPEAQGGAL